MPIINTQVKGQGGVQPSGTITIPNNGTYDVTNYAVADVQVPTTAPAHYLEFTNTSGTLSKSTTLPNLNGVTTISDYAFQYMFYQNAFPSGSKIDMSGITTIGQNGCYYMLGYSSGITEIDLSSLTSIGLSGLAGFARASSSLQKVDMGSLTTINADGVLVDAFRGCSNLTSIDLHSLQTVSSSSSAAMDSSTFNGTHLTSLSMPNLTTVSSRNSINVAYNSYITSLSLPSLRTGTVSCYYCTSLTSVDLSSLTTISNIGGMFYKCSSLTSLNLPSVTTLSTNANYGEGLFQECSGLTSLSLGKLYLITGNTCANYLCRQCSVLTDINLDSLVVTNGNNCQNVFYLCSALKTLRLSSYKTTTNQNNFYNAFNGTSMENVYFPAFTESSFYNTSTFASLLSSVTGCTLHFPKNLDPQTGSTVISSLSGYPNFGGTNTVLAFDLPSTNHLIGVDTIEYERNPKYDTVSALAWRVKDTGTTANPTIDWTPYYTSTTNDPAVGDTIYSDAACTTAVTTIDSIV